MVTEKVKVLTLTKIAALAAAALVFIALGTGCSSSVEIAEAKDQFEVAESVYTCNADNWTYDYAFILRNKHDKKTISKIEYRIAGYDENDEKIEYTGDWRNSTMMVGPIKPGEEIAIAGCRGYDDVEDWMFTKAPSRIELELISLDWGQSRAPDVEVSNIVIGESGPYGMDLIVTLKNNSDQDISTSSEVDSYYAAYSAVFRDSDGKVVGGSEAFITDDDDGSIDIPAGEEKTVTMFSSYTGSFSDCEIYISW